MNSSVGRVSLKEAMSRGAAMAERAGRSQEAGDHAWSTEEWSQFRDDLVMFSLYELPQLVEALGEATTVLNMALPALGMHARGFSQEALVRACALVSSQPEDWTQHPETMERRREIWMIDGDPDD